MTRVRDRLACPSGATGPLSFSRTLLFIFCLFLASPCRADVFSLDDDSVDASGGTPGGDLLALNHFDTAGRTVIIDQISVLWNPISGNASPTVVLYLDPNGDGNPNDAVPLVVMPIEIPVNVVILNNTTLQSYSIPPTTVVGSFFVGAFVSDRDSGFTPTIGVDTSHPQANQSWIIENSNLGGLDLEAPFATSTLVAPLNNFISGNHMIRARYVVVLSCAPLPAGAIGYWPGENSARDAAATYSGTFAGPVSFGPGKVRLGFMFPGLSRARIDLGNPQATQLQDFTIQAWIKRSSASDISLDDQGEDGSEAAEGGCILSYGRHGYGFGLKNDGALFLGSVDMTEATAPGPADVEWHHVAVTKSGTEVAFYLDGARTGGAAFGSSFEFNSPAAIGSRGDGHGGTFYGMIDEVALFNRALESEEICSIYAAGATGFCPVSPGGPPTILIPPQSQTRAPGSVATLSVIAEGASPLSYQWFFNAAALEGRTNAAFTLSNLQPGHAGAYWVTVSNRLGIVTSATAQLQVGAVPPPSCVATPTGAVAWWRAETNAMDSIGINDAVVDNPPAPELFYTTGKVGRAFRFIGGPVSRPIPITEISVPPSGDLDLGAGEGLTLEGWVRPEVLASFQPLVEWNDERGNVGFGVGLNGSALEAVVTDTNTVPVTRAVLRSPAGIVVSSVWQHLALTLDRGSGSTTLYLNGVAVAQTNVAGLIPQTRVPIYLGFRPSGGYAGSRYRGMIDELTIYNRALDEEIGAIVRADERGKCPPGPAGCAPPPPDLVAWWRWENNLLDSVDRNNAARVNLVRYTNGVVGRAIWLESGYLRVPTSTNLDLGAGPGLTIEGWFWPASAGVRAAWGSRRQEFVGWHHATVTQAVNLSFGSSGSWLGNESQFWQANLVDSEGRPHILNGPSRLAQVGGWQHVALTYERASGSAVLFFNGNAVAQTNVGTLRLFTQGDLHFGHRPQVTPPYWVPFGLDDVSLYTRALDPAEVRVLMLSRGAGKCREAPVIASQPVGARVNEGDTVSFNVVATGNPILRYQWLRNGTSVPGATDASLVLSNLIWDRAGAYSVRVTNAFGRVTSSNAVLTLNRAPTADASATRPVVMVPLGCVPAVVLDGSRSSDPDGDPLHFVWTMPERGVALATGRVAVVSLPPGTNVVKLTVDDGLATNSQVRTVEVITSLEAVQRLARLVSELVSREQPLLAALQAAATSIERNNPTAAINQLQAFSNKVSAQVAPVDPALSERLELGAQEIIDLLSSGCAPRPRGRLDKVWRHTSGKMRIEFTAPRGSVYIIEASTDLLHWEKIGVAVDSPAGHFGFEEPNAVSGVARFFRVIVAQAGTMPP